MTNDQTRLREQCFLISFIDEFARLNRGALGTGGGAGDPAPDTSEEEFTESLREAERRLSGNAAEVTFAQGTKIYNNFVCMMARNPASIVSRLVTDRGLTELFNLTPDQMAAVMPKLRIFKVQYSGPNDRVGVSREFIFGENYARADVASMVVDRKGRGSGVGLKSFDWQLIGTNTAEVDNNIKANLTIHFNSFQDFLDEEVIQWALRQSSLERDVSGLESELPTDKANYLDLIFRTTKYREASNGEEEFNQRYYRIKVVTGWTVDPQVVRQGLISSDLRRKIESTGTTLLLNLLRHDIDFREDGTVELKLEYHASVEGMLTDDGSNLLYASTADFEQVLQTVVDGEATTSTETASDFETLRQLQARQRELEAEQQEAQASEETPGEEEDECYQPYEGRQLVDRFGPNNYTAEEQIQDDINYVRQAQRRILTRIYQRMLEELQESSMYYVDVPESVFSEDEDGGVTSVEDFDRFGAGQAPGAAARSIRTFSDELQDEMEDENTFGTGIQTDAGVAASLAGEGATNINVIPVAERRGNWDPLVPDTRRIFYFYLGDLLEIALNILKREDNPDELGDVRIILGTIAAGMPDFRLSYLQRRASKSEGSRGNRVLINMADIPISLNLFLQFYTDRVIARGRTTWPLRTFIREVFTYLINPALGSGCAERGHSRAPNVSISHYSAYGDSEGNDRVTGREGDFGRRRLYDNEIEPLSDAGRLQDRALYHYVLIQSGDYVSTGRLATDSDSPSYDAEDGIYWLNIGNDRGIVKSIKFKRTDVPGLAEARQEREGTIGLGQIRDKYDADVTLFGNGLFQPGQLIYINPTAVGLSSPGVSTRLSSIIGIGGYYQIISVDSAISDQTYETILNTKWVASGTGLDEPENSDDCN